MCATVMIEHIAEEDDTYRRILAQPCGESRFILLCDFGVHGVGSLMVFSVGASVAPWAAVSVIHVSTKCG